MQCIIINGTGYFKYDETGQPKRAKYRIVALGNMDPYAWEKSDCYAPVISQLELRLLVS